jgi:hypothetical protein
MIALCMLWSLLNPAAAASDSSPQLSGSTKDAVLLDVVIEVESVSG